jgi:hypothetical protein
VSDEPPPLGERVAALEADVENLKVHSRALQGTLHDLIKQALADQAAAITRLSTAHDTRLGIWWALVWISAGLVIVIGGIAWLLEHQVEIVVKP